MRNILRVVFIATLTMGLMANQTLAQEQCSDKPSCWPEGSAMRTAFELKDHLDRTEKTLTQKHQELLLLLSNASGAAKVDGRVITALKAQQDGWLKYRTEECELIGALSGAGGSWPTTHALRCEANHTDRRLRSVQSALACVAKVPKNSSGFDQHACLQQLAPLTNKK
jgi:uncharacterized protein YecT (DUF1311 family)